MEEIPHSLDAVRVSQHLVRVRGPCWGTCMLVSQYLVRGRGGGGVERCICSSPPPRALRAHSQASYGQVQWSAAQRAAARVADGGMTRCCWCHLPPLQANTFIQTARRSSHRPESPEQALQDMIYNWKVGEGWVGGGAGAGDGGHNQKLRARPKAGGRLPWTWAWAGGAQSCLRL